MVLEDSTVCKCSIDEVTDYAICPARALITKESKKVPPLIAVRRRLRLATNDLTLRSLDKEEISETDISRAASHVVGKVAYDNRDSDLKEAVQLFVNFNNLLARHEYTITGSVIPVEISYGGVIVQSQIDCTVKEFRSGYIYPVIIDFSKTRYEPFYNPIAYRCQVAVDHLEAEFTNTECIVLGLARGDKWTFEKRKYSPLLRASITEMALSMADDRWPVRFGWWCAGCPYRGICHRLL